MHRSLPNLFPVELCALFFIFISLLLSQFRYPIHTIIQTFVYSTHRVLFIEEAEFSFIGLLLVCLKTRALTITYLTVQTV